MNPAETPNPDRQTRIEAMNNNIFSEQNVNYFGLAASLLIIVLLFMPVPLKTVLILAIPLNLFAFAMKWFIKSKR